MLQATAQVYAQGLVASKTMRKRFRYSVYLLYWYKKVQILTLRTHTRLDEAHAKALAPLAFAAMAKAEV
jgi:hypothetical protein